MRTTRLIPALVAAGAVVAVVAPAGAKAAAPACQASQLVATLNDGSGAAGSTYWKLTFSNLGPACTLGGYPGVSAVGLNGRQIGSAASRSGTTGGKTVTLKAASAISAPDSTSVTLRIVEALD